MNFPEVESREPILLDYHKILGVVGSCKEEKQFDSAINMIENFVSKWVSNPSLEILSGDLYKIASILKNSITTTTTIPQ